MKIITERHPNPVCFSLHLDKKLPPYSRYDSKTPKPELVNKLEDINGITSVSFHDLFVIQLLVGRCFHMDDVEKQAIQVVKDHFDAADKNAKVAVESLLALDNYYSPKGSP